MISSFPLMYSTNSAEQITCHSNMGKTFCDNIWFSCSSMFCFGQKTNLTCVVGLTTKPSLLFVHSDVVVCFSVHPNLDD